MKKILFAGIISLFFVSCKKTTIVEDRRSDTEPASYLIEKPTDTLTQAFFNNFCYGGTTDELIGQKISTNKGKQRVYLVPVPEGVKTAGQVRGYLDGEGYTPSGAGYFFKIIDQFQLPKGIMISTLDCRDLNMHNYQGGTWMPVKEIMFEKDYYGGSGCINAYTYETGNTWTYQVFYVCFKK